MIKSNPASYTPSEKKWLLAGVPLLILIASLMHYLYEWTGNALLIGLFSPVNESVWEHLKMTYLPVLFWWIAGFIYLRKYTEIRAAQWFGSCTVSILICPLVIVAFFYSYTGAFGIESLLMDIFSLILGVFVGQLTAYHFYKHSKFYPAGLVISIAILLSLAFVFIIFTFNPPQIPLFLDSLTDQYGI